MTKLTPERLSEANVNPATYLATDYLNVFNEALMLIGLAADDPEILDELNNWSAPGYADHFEQTQFRDREIVIAAYQAADPERRTVLELRAKALEAMIIAEAAGLKAAIGAGGPRPEDVASAVDMLQSYITRLDALITGSMGVSQNTIDAFFP